MDEGREESDVGGGSAARGLFLENGNGKEHFWRLGMNVPCMYSCDSNVDKIWAGNKVDCDRTAHTLCKENR